MKKSFAVTPDKACNASFVAGPSKGKKTSIIHSARPTVPPVAITILIRKVFYIVIFRKVGTDVQTTRAVTVGRPRES